MLSIFGQLGIAVVRTVERQRHRGNIAEIIIDDRRKRAFRERRHGFGHGLCQVFESHFEIRRVKIEPWLDDRHTIH